MKIKIKNTKNEKLDVLPTKSPSTPKKHVFVNEDKSQKAPSTLPYILYFFTAVLICIVIALAVRFLFTFRNSTFSTPAYSVLVSNDNPYIAVLDTNAKRVSLVEIENLPSKSRVKNSVELGVPIDGHVKAGENSFSKETFPSLSVFIASFLRPWIYGYDGMTSLDAAKVLRSAMGISKKDIVEKSVSFKDGEIEGLSESELYDIFKDSTIIDEQMSIEVVNATSQEGLAGNVGILLKNTGGNVVSVSSAPDKEKSSIVAQSPSVTLTRMSHILGITPTIQENFASISDIKIVLGRDFAKKIQ